MKITKLTAQNVKRLSAVEITPDGHLVVIGGQNGAGKSSVLDSIMYALAGSGTIPSQPIRNGAKAGKITIELDGERTLIVERTLTESGGSLSIRPDAKSKPLASPQALLDSLCGKIAFDPLEFSRLKPREQAERLRDLVGLDFTELDAQRQRIFDQRTVVNRDAKAIKARVDAIQVPAGTPAEAVSVADLANELKARLAANEENERVRAKLDRCQKALASKDQEISGTRALIAELKKRLAEEEQVEKTLLDERAEINEILQERWNQVANLVQLDVDEIQQQIASAESVNAGVRKAEERKRLAAEFAAKCGEAEAITEQIETIDASKRQQMEAAAWPVPGLGFDESGVTYNGLPFCQASSAEALRVSVAIGAAMNPVLRVMLIRDGSLLDNHSLQAVAEIAEQRDLQVWLERVGDGEECSVIIEDGHNA